MSDDVKDAIDYLKACGLVHVARGTMWEVEKCTKAVAVFNRLASENAALRAEVERLTPKPMTNAEVCEVLNRNEGRPGCWNEEDGGFALLRRLGPGMLERLEVIEHRKAAYIAQGLLRDAGPTAEREPARGEEAQAADKLIQCTKCGCLLNSSEAKCIRFYAEHKPLPYCPQCYDAIPFVYQHRYGEPARGEERGG